MTPTPPPAMILAGGRATRMGGGDKPLLALAGRPLLAHILDRLRPQVALIALNANGDPARFAAFGLAVQADGVAGYPGPLAGILAAMDWAVAMGAAQVLTVPGDSPFLPADLVARLQAAQGPGGLALAASRDDRGGIRPHPTIGLWPTALRGDLARALAADLRRVRDVTQAHRPGIALWDQIPDPFANLNTPDDLAAARVRLAAL